MTERTKNEEGIVDADDASVEAEPSVDAGVASSSGEAEGDVSPSGDGDGIADATPNDPDADAMDAEGATGAEGTLPDGDGTKGEATTGDGEQEGDELSALRAEYDRVNDRHLRLVAEFNNFRRRSEQERLSAWSRAQADLAEGLLDVLDDLQRVAELDLSNATVEAIMEGIDLVERKFVRKLEEAGIEVMEPTGEPFDPERMEAMMRVPAESDEQVDTVAQVFQKGYSLKGILVRPARVSVYTQG